MEQRKEAILNALRAFVVQRPGLEFGNYGDVSSYRSEMRSITKDRHQAETLLNAVAWRDSITADNLIESAKSAYSGRLSIKDVSAHYDDGSTYHKFSIDYCAGQYFPTEYRKAVCAVLARALWYWMRDCMPSKIVREGREFYPHANGSRNEQSAGDWLRSKFRQEFGRNMQSRWFD